jgi:hypothetical protein
VSLYRKFAGCDVWLEVDAAPATAPSPKSYSTDAQAPAAASSQSSSEPPLGTFSTPRAPSTRSPFVYSQIEDANGAQQDAAEEDQEEAPRTWSEDEIEQAVACGFCHEPLPRERLVNFCPFCGSDQRNLPCASCGEALESGWRFCASCGATVAHGPSAGAA